ncbi:MAG: SAM-dependent methyltransferase [Candidatus Thorarchaeota archaeon]|nr:MAG: SAM-dependent methyltransferase [Candidatus Thorarchaeota archaeon]
MSNKPDLALALELLKNPKYPRTAKYDPEWLVGLDMGCPTFWLLERLCEAMELRPGMRVLDLGCGKAGGSIFLAKEYGLQVWAADLWISPNENWQRIRDAGLEAHVFPIRAEANKLPFAEQFFDAVIAVNSLFFFGTDDVYLRHHLVNIVKPGGQFGIVVPGFYNEFQGDLPATVPDHLKVYWESCMLYTWHSAEWWRRHWLKTNQVEVELADNFPDNEGYQTYLDWERIIRYKEKLAEDDAGRNITFVRLVARRRT